MALVTHKFKLDLTPGASRQVLYTSQGDIGRPFEADLYWNGSPWTATGTTANIRGKKPDDTVFDYTATVSGTAVTFETTEQMTIISGPVECELVFSNDGDVIASANFVLIVEDSPYDPDALSESVIPGIVDLIEDTIGGDVRDEVDALVTAHPELMLQDNAVTTAKIASGAVTEGKIASNAVTTGKLATGAVTAAKVDADFLKTIENAYVTPEQFGAVGDGTTDDSAAVQAAINSGKNVYFPNKYYLGETIELNKVTGVKLFGRADFGSGTNDFGFFSNTSPIFHFKQCRNIRVEKLNFIARSNNISALLFDTTSTMYCTFIDVSVFGNGSADGGTGVDGKALYYCNFYGGNFYGIQTGVKCGNNHSGSGSVNFYGTHFGQSSVACYFDSDSDFNLNGITIENVGTALYVGGTNNMVSVSQSYIGDGMKQVAIVKDTAILKFSEMTQNLFAYGGTIPSILETTNTSFYVDDQATLLLSNSTIADGMVNSQGRIATITKPSINAKVIMDNVSVKGANIFDGGNYYLKKNCENYITGYTFSGSGSWGAFNITQTMLNEYSANGFQKFTLSNSTDRTKMFAWKANYTVPKAGIYYLVLSESNAPQDNEYVSFEFPSSSNDFILGSSEDTTGINETTWGRYRYPFGAGNITGAPTRMTLRPAFVTQPGSVVIVPVFLGDTLTGSIYMHTTDTRDVDKTVNMIGLVDNFNFSLEFPVWY